MEGQMRKSNFTRNNIILALKSVEEGLTHDLK